MGGGGGGGGGALPPLSSKPAVYTENGVGKRGGGEHITSRATAEKFQ